MKGAATAGRSVHRAQIVQFLRFAVVGAVGYLVDSGMLFGAVHLLGLDPIRGRLLSFAIAVMTTFELNRRWAFRHRARTGYVQALAAYLGVQGLGFALNLGIYTILYLGLPPPYNAPQLCLAVASGLALVVNYAGASLLVFRPPPIVKDPP